MKKQLGLKDLTALGIAAIIGAGIFGTIGSAASESGPAVILIFIFTAFACGLSALCYAQFSSVMPSSGSAYSYAHKVFGTLLGWIIGWDLIMEYAIGNIAVAISWSDYFTGLLAHLGIKFPEWLSTDYFSGVEKLNAPQIAGFKIIFDLPAILITVFIGYLTYIGIKESKNTSNMLVIIKLGVILGIICIGLFWIEPANWSPFMPNGFNGMFKGVSAIFFAYIGFDAISTTAEECINPQKDLPKAMIYSLIICTILYIALALVLTGMVPYQSLNVGDPLAYVFAEKGMYQISISVAISALVAYTGVLLVFQIGQPRIWLAMSRDGLLPSRFSRIHPRFHTPSFASVVAVIIVILPIFFLNMNEVTDLTSIGTLFAFGLVCAGVMLKGNHEVFANATFKVPYLPSRTLGSITLILTSYIIFKESETISQFETLLKAAMLFSILLLISGIVFNWSFLPLLGLISNVLLLGTMSQISWLRFLIWLVIGLCVYYFYGRKKALKS